MDEHTPIDVPIRLEEWDRHDCINEVDTIVVDIRPILDATDYGHLPAPDDWAADFIAEQAQRLGLLRLWDGPFTVELPECGEYPAYIEWLGDEADREWERAKDGLSDGYGGFDAYTRAIQHCQDMIVEDEASSGKHTEIALLKHLADTFDERLRKAERAKDRGAGYTYNDGRPDAYGWAATYCCLMIEASLNGKESD